MTAPNPEIAEIIRRLEAEREKARTMDLHDAVDALVRNTRVGTYAHALAIVKAFSSERAS